MEAAATASLMEEPTRVPLTPITRAVITGTDVRTTSTVITSPKSRADIKLRLQLKNQHTVQKSERSCGNNVIKSCEMFSKI